MWFAFPDGTTSISVQQHEFQVEAEDEDGTKYFRAPDHFAGLILDLPGFKVTRPPKTDLADLPQPDSLRDSTISAMGTELSTLKTEIAELRSMIANGEKELRLEKDKASSLERERDALLGRIETLEKGAKK